MKRQLFVLVILGLTISCSESITQKEIEVEQLDQPVKIVNTPIPDSIDISKYEILGLPCPNSSTHAGGPWTSEEAESHKHEIYDMAITARHWDWKNPTSGGAVHINENDQVEVYQFTLGHFKGNMGDTAVSYGPVDKGSSLLVPVDELWSNVSGIGFGNETSVIITTEIPLKDSKVFPEVMKVLFSPGVQIYYLKEQE